jgi:8-oxo-dGTP pyrophosphatase MutT (NUDIX family)
MTAERPREAATVILVRDQRSGGIEVLLVRRGESVRVLPGFWVFPGGTVDPGDGDQRFRAAAVRELAEETAITGLDVSDLVPFAHWITPESVAARYDTHFFLARAPATNQTPRVDGTECTEARWISPSAALRNAHEGAMRLMLPTLRELERLRTFASVSMLLDAAD